MRDGTSSKRWLRAGLPLVLLLVLCISVSVLFEASDDIRGCLYFRLLQTAWRLEYKEEQRPLSDWLVARLEESPTGLRLAARDCSTTGGTTGAGSSVILLRSRLKERVIAALESAAIESSTPLDHRIEIYLILWERTRDVAYCRRLFLSVRDAVEKSSPRNYTAVMYGRAKLALMLAEDQRSGINVPPDQPLHIKEEDLDGILLRIQPAPV
ncbi:MAG: hypothetical protein NTU53_01195 [Planctomycetota bacterium]|nr:hypothetical protein [Planctomycetota bacterium]